jgi:hypothetical protein
MPSVSLYSHLVHCLVVSLIDCLSRGLLVHCAVGCFSLHLSRVHGLCPQPPLPPTTHHVVWTATHPPTYPPTYLHTPPEDVHTTHTYTHTHTPPTPPTHTYTPTAPHTHFTHTHTHHTHTHTHLYTHTHFTTHTHTHIHTHSRSGGWPALGSNRPGGWLASAMANLWLACVAC